MHHHAFLYYRIYAGFSRRPPVGRLGSFVRRRHPNALRETLYRIWSRVMYTRVTLQLHGIMHINFIQYVRILQQFAFLQFASMANSATFSKNHILTRSCFFKKSRLSAQRKPACLVRSCFFQIFTNSLPRGMGSTSVLRSISPISSCIISSRTARKFSSSHRLFTS